MSAEIETDSASGWPEQVYGALLSRLEPELDHLPRALRRRWSYYFIWPNLAFDVYPDQIDFMQMIPLSPTKTLIREIPYALPGDTNPRALRLARYVNWRINRVVNREDTGLIERVQQGMASAGFSQGPLSERERCLNGFAERLRQQLPLCRQAAPPTDAEFQAAAGS